MKPAAPQFEITALTPEEEQQLLERQKRLNRIVGWTLILLVILGIIATMLMVAKFGFVPLQDQDIFRST